MTANYCPTCGVAEGLHHRRWQCYNVSMSNSDLDTVSSPVSLDDVHRLIESYRCDYLRWQATRDPGDQPKVDNALDQLDYWLEVQRRFA